MFFDDAPVIEETDVALISDVYVYTETADDSGDAQSAAASKEDFLSDIIASASDPADEGEAASTLLMSDEEDVFVFSTLGAGNGSAAPDSATPAPPETESPEDKALRELMEREKNPGEHWARHTATGAILKRFLIEG